MSFSRTFSIQTPVTGLRPLIVLTLCLAASLTASASQADIRSSVLDDRTALAVTPNAIITQSFVSATPDKFVRTSLPRSGSVHIAAMKGNAFAYAGYHRIIGGPAVLAELEMDVCNIFGGQATKATVVLAAPVDQDTVVKLYTYNPALSLPDSVTVPAGQTEAEFPITSTPVTVTTNGSIIAELNGVVEKYTIKVMPDAPASASVAANYLPEGQTTIGTVTLQVPASPGAIIVNITSSNPAVASVPATVTVPQGAATATFPILTGPVTMNTPVLITVGANGVTATTTLTVRPIRVSTVVASPSIISGGSVGLLTATLESPAPFGGTIVRLQSSNPGVQVPSTILIPAGSVSGQVSFTASKVNAKTSVVVTASSRVNNVYGNITVTP